MYVAVLIKKYHLIKKKYQLINFVQIHCEQQKNKFYLFVVLEEISFQINIIQKQQQCCKFIICPIAITHYIQMTLGACTQLAKLSNNCHIRKKKYIYIV